MLISAHDYNHRGQNRFPGGPHPSPRSYPHGNFDRSRGAEFLNRLSQMAEDVKVSGNLAIQRGMIAVESDGITYLTGGLNRFVGFIDGLKEGARVTLEGWALPVPQDEKTKFVRVQKLTLDGKEYDLGMPRHNFQNERSPRMQHPGNPGMHHPKDQPMPRGRW
jgi:hypothetical protein